MLYLHRVTENRERGSDLRNLRVFKKLCGEENFGNIVLGITWWDEEDDDVARAREEVLRSTPEFWGDMIRKGSRVQRVPMDSEGCVNLLLGFAGREATTLRIQREMIDEKKAADETGAASELDRQSKLRALEAEEKVKNLAQQNLKRDALHKLDQQAAEKASEQKLLFHKKWERREAEERLLREQRERELYDRGSKEGIGRFLQNLEATTRHRKSLQTQSGLLNQYKRTGWIKQNFKFIQQQVGFQQVGSLIPWALHRQFCDHCLIQLPLFDAYWSELSQACLILLPAYHAKLSNRMRKLRQRN